MNKFFAVTFIFLIFNIFAPITCYSKNLKMGITKPAFESPHGKFMEALYSEIFEKLGHKLSIEVIPPIRLALKTKNGDIDGELVRMSGYDKEHPELIKVEEECFKFNYFAYSVVNSKSFSFKENHLIVGYRKGVKVVENPLLDSFSIRNLRPFTDMNQAFEQLKHQRINYYIGIGHFVDDLLKNKLKKYSAEIVKINKVGSDKAHMYLTKSHLEIAPLISRELKLMKKSGRYGKIKEKYLSLH